MKKILVIGFGKSGKAAAEFLLKQNKKVIAVDQKSLEIAKNPEVQELLKNGLQLLPDLIEKIDFSEIGQVILSPGVIPSHPLAKEAQKRKIEIIGEIELGFRHLKNPAIGVTGTNGKTTVTLLCAHILNYAGMKATLLGNMGTPLTSFAGKSDEILVVELSSFQLETLRQKCLDAAVVLNITPDHLDRYPTLIQYAGAKLRIRDVMKEEGKLFISKSVSEKFLPDEKYPLYDDVSDLEGKRFLAPLISGKIAINRENALAAFRLCSHFGVKPKTFMEALKTFKAPPHRIEYVAEINEISFYNDSKATNVESVIHAVKTLSGPIILIAGGLDKGTPFSPWIQTFKGKVKRVYVIGIAAKKIKQELESSFEVIHADSLFDAVQKAYKSAARKDQILLSPGCASFDSFRNYEHRGEEFKRCVKELRDC